MKIRNTEFNFGERTYIMGILNVTPDSFSDGGKFNEIDDALIQVRKLVAEGADIIDIGGESTRPGAKIVSIEEEISRVVPVIEAIRKEMDVVISIDTYNSAMAKIAAKYNVPCILMHNRIAKPYKDLEKEFISDLEESINIALEAGVKKENIILDPGIGFAKTYEENLMVMNNLKWIKDMGYPVLLATSRKSMIGLALDLPVDERLEGTLATTVIGIMAGCEIIRVHDVLENKRVCIMTDTILRAK